MRAGLRVWAAAGVAVGAALAGAAEGRKDGAGMELVELTNGAIVVGVLPPLGGRVVRLKTVGGENVLDADPRHWTPPYPPPAITTGFRPWHGRIVWSGPQSAFWSQQDLRPDRRTAGAIWPPDPFNETGRFETLERTATLLRLRGPVSPVTGLSLEHEYEITGERTVRMKTTATNGRAAPVSWDLWPNTRVRPEGHPYVRNDPAQMLRMDGPRPDEAEAGPYPSESLRGWLTFPPGRKPEGGRKRLWSKAYVRPAEGLIAYFLGRRLLLIRAPVVPPRRLHGDQAFIEVYRASGKGGDILELEMHGPYETLAPGAAMSFEQTFELLDHGGPATPDGHLERLETLVGRTATLSP